MSTNSQTLASDRIDLAETTTDDDAGVSPVLVMQAVWSAWADGDLPSLMSWYADDAVWSINVPRDLLPFGGENVGKAAITDAFTAAGAQFETLYFRPKHIDFRDGVVRCYMQFGFRHRLTGHELEDTSTYRCIVSGGLVRRVDATYDIDKMRAFMGIVADRAARMKDDLLRAD